MLTIYSEGTRSGSPFYSAAKARQSLQHACMGYLTYVADTRVVDKGSNSIYDVPVVCNFSDVFPKKFHIDLILDAVQIAKAPYRLAPSMT